jgi:hypothetical protein
MMQINLIRKKRSETTLNIFNGIYEICIPLTAVEVERITKLAVGEMEMLTIEGCRDD